MTEFSILFQGAWCSCTRLALANARHQDGTSSESFASKHARRRVKKNRRLRRAMLGKQRAVCRERSSKHASDIATEPSDSQQQFTSPVYSTRQVEPFRRPIKSGGTLLNFNFYEFLVPFHLRNQTHSGHDCRLRQFRRATSRVTCPPSPLPALVRNRKHQ